MSACEFCGVDHDSEDAHADTARELASLRERAEKAEAEVAKLTRERGMLYASLAASERLRILHSPIHGPSPTYLTQIKKALREIVRIGNSDASPAARIDRMKRAARAALSPSPKGMP